MGKANKRMKESGNTQIWVCESGTLTGDFPVVSPTFNYTSIADSICYQDLG